jgi:hypothetical protein
MSINELFFDDVAEEHLISFGGRVLAFEREGIFQDSTFDIEWAIRTPTLYINHGDQGVIHFLFIDANTGGVLVTPTLTIDGTPFVLPAFSSSVRQTHEFPINRKCHFFELDLAAIASARIQIHGIAVDTRDGRGREYRE